MASTRGRTALSFIRVKAVVRVVSKLNFELALELFLLEQFGDIGFRCYFHSVLVNYFIFHLFRIAIAIEYSKNLLLFYFGFEHLEFCLQLFGL